MAAHLCTPRQCRCLNSGSLVSGGSSFPAHLAASSIAIHDTSRLYRQSISGKVAAPAATAGAHCCSGRSCRANRPSLRGWYCRKPRCSSSMVASTCRVQRLEERRLEEQRLEEETEGSSGVRRGTYAGAAGGLSCVARHCGLHSSCMKEPSANTNTL